MTAFLSTPLVFPSSPGSPTAGPRRGCFDVTITSDDLLENTESFSLLLQEDIFSQQTGATINPNRIEIFILDREGNFCNVPILFQLLCSAFVEHLLRTLSSMSLCVIIIDLYQILFVVAIEKYL